MKRNKMRYAIFFWLLLFVLKGFGQAGVFDPNYPRDGIYIKENTRKVHPRYYQIPEIRFLFDELKDSVSVKEARKKISPFAKYKKAPFEFKKMYFVNPALQQSEIITSLSENYLNIQALRYYIDTSSFVFRKLPYVAIAKTTIPLQQIFQPFYICETEVTVEEYNEFVYYVRDSLARTLLARSGAKFASKYGTEIDDTLHLDWKTKIEWHSNDDNYKEELSVLYLPMWERYYNRKEIDVRKLNHVFYFINKDNKTQKDVVNVYPDTLAWVHNLRVFETEYVQKKVVSHGTEDFPDADSNVIVPRTKLSEIYEPFTNMYQWHPAYKNYPVVGLNFVQVQAFLTWKKIQLQKELNAKGIKLEIELDLPNSIEWEMVSTAVFQNNNWNYFSAPNKKSYKTNQNFDPELQLTNYNDFVDIDTMDKPYFRQGADNHYPFKSFSPSKKTNYTSFISNINLQLGHPISCSPDKLKTGNENLYLAERRYREMLQNKNFVSFFNGNVSEWGSERMLRPGKKTYTKAGKTDSVSVTCYPIKKWSFPYTGNSEDIYDCYMKMIESFNGPEVKNYSGDFKNKLANFVPNSRLVQGANFYDQGDIINGANKFTFVSEDSAHCTLGFRYVIRFKEKN
ncbi:MAG: hypothetical protein IAF38_22370 [Bacteroidia bacterium]|nr:hypothetical protein [Bacteroidia bacterium]